jgi:cbb3-type cytochrome oxidase subunit 3
VLFIALCVYAWSGRRRAEFEAAARLPFDEAEEPARTSGDEH